MKGWAGAALALALAAGACGGGEAGTPPPAEAPETTPAPAAERPADTAPQPPPTEAPAPAPEEEPETAGQTTEPEAAGRETGDTRDTGATGDTGEAAQEGGGRPADTAAQPPPTEAPAPAPEEEPETAGQVIELEIVDGGLEGGARREAVNLGGEVTLRVGGNSRGDVHVHGYDLYVRLEEGAGELVFEASIPGVFEVEMEDSHTLLIQLEVS